MPSHAVFTMSFSFYTDACHLSSVELARDLSPPSRSPLDFGVLPTYSRLYSCPFPALALEEAAELHDQCPSVDLCDIYGS